MRPSSSLALVLALQQPTLLQQARAAAERRHLDTAYTIIQRAAEAEPNNAEVQYWLGELAGERAQQVNRLFALGIAKKSKRGYTRAVELEPGNPTYLEGLIGFLTSAPGFAGGDKDSAMVLAEALRRIDEWRGTNEIATILWRRNDARKKAAADSIIDAYGRAHPTDRLAQFRVGNFYAQTERPERALAINERALARDSNDVVARYGVARNLVVLKRDPRRALNYFHFIAARDRPTGENVPSFSPVGLWWRIGQAYRQLDLNDSARAAYQQALRVQPNFRNAQLSLDSLPH